MGDNILLFVLTVFIYVILFIFYVKLLQLITNFQYLCYKYDILSKYILQYAQKTKGSHIDYLFNTFIHKENLIRKLMASFYPQNYDTIY